MILNRKKIIPVILGGDLNAYSVARSFYERYGAVSHVFMRHKTGATSNSKFIITHLCSGLCDVKIAIPELLTFAVQNPKSELYLIPCTDGYTEMLVKSENILSGMYNMTLPNGKMFKELTNKHIFRGLMSENGFTVPKTATVINKADLNEEKLSKVSYPAVLKPASSIEYYKHPFADMQKVYFPQNSKEAVILSNKILSSGYSGEILVEEFIENAENRVLTTFSDSKGRVVRIAYGNVILEERGKSSFGNHSAIITLPQDELTEKIKVMLNKIGYVGFANIDIMISNGKKYVLELNARQGRSCDYLRAMGISIAELLVENAKNGQLENDFLYREVYWHYPSHKTVMKYSLDEEGKKRAAMLYRRGLSYSPYDSKKETAVRRLYSKIHLRRLDKRISETYRNGSAK